MTRAITGTALALFAGCAAYGQAADPTPAFEVASVKLAALAEGPRIMQCKGGPGSSDPGLFTCTNYNLANLVSYAFDLRAYQFSGADYADRKRYNITAKVPPGTTKEQFKLMFQNLLVERFKLAYRYEKKESDVYDLVVTKGGLKMKESPPADSTPQSTPQPARSRQVTLGADGYPDIPPVRRGGSAMYQMNGRARWASSETTMEDLVQGLSAFVGRPITDATGLKGKYDFTLSWVIGSGVEVAASDNDAGPSLVEAVREQLGLKLEPKKGTVDVFVTDHVEKTPTEN
jgi:uncharacterized protein (TIGR03435 family)